MGRFISSILMTAYTNMVLMTCFAVEWSGVCQCRVGIVWYRVLAFEIELCMISYLMLKGSMDMG